MHIAIIRIANDTRPRSRRQMLWPCRIQVRITAEKDTPPPTHTHRVSLIFLVVFLHTSATTSSCSMWFLSHHIGRSQNIPNCVNIEGALSWRNGGQLGIRPECLPGSAIHDARTHCRKGPDPAPSKRPNSPMGFWIRRPAYSIFSDAKWAAGVRRRKSMMVPGAHIPDGRIWHPNQNLPFIKIFRAPR